MSIIVHRDEPIDDALKRLHSEAIRENIFNSVNKKRYFIKDSKNRSIKKREWKKRKRRHRTAKRKVKNKGKFNIFSFERFLNAQLTNRIKKTSKARENSDIQELL